MTEGLDSNLPVENAPCSGEGGRPMINWQNFPVKKLGSRVHSLLSARKQWAGYSKPRLSESVHPRPS